MKKLTFLILLLFTGLLISNSCKKTEELIDEIVPEFSADIDGVQWKTNSVAAIKTDTGYVITANKDSTTFLFMVSKFETKKYSIDNAEIVATYTKDNPSNTYVAYTGEVEILEASDKGKNFNIRFHYKCINTAIDTVNITNGVANNVINPI